MIEPSLRSEPAPDPSPWVRVAQVFRAVALVASAVLVAEAQASFRDPWRQQIGWWLALAAVAVAAIWQYRLTIAEWRQPAGRQWGLAPQWWRRILGAAIVIAGVAAWWDGSRNFALGWDQNFDRGWLSWVAATVVMSLGLRVLQSPSATASNHLRRWEWAAVILIFATAIGFRLANIQNYPPNDGVSQVEELQQGQWATEFINGGRGHWEFLGPTWGAALGILLGGPSLRAVRVSYSVMSFLKVLPVYFWFRALAGPAGAMTGAALLALSGWDTVIVHVSGHPDPLVLSCCWALLTGPLVRGVWAAFPWVALLAGYSISTYIAYRPLVIFAIVGVAIASLARLHSHRWRSRLLAVVPVLALVALLAGVLWPLLHRLPGQRFPFEYFNGWNRAHAIEEYYGSHDSWSVALHKRWLRTVEATSLFYTQGDMNPTHNAGQRPLTDPVTTSLLLFGVTYGTAMALRGFYGLTLGAFAVVFTGTLIATGNFDVVRAGATIPYVYALAAIGAGGLYAAAGNSLGRIGRILAAIALLGGVLWAGYWNVSLLQDMWASPVTRQHYRSDLAYLSTWLGQNARGWRVIGLIPNSASVVFLENDSSWLRGHDVKGEAAWDVKDMMHRVEKERGQIMLLVGSASTRDVIEFFQYVWPDLPLQPRFDDNGDMRMAYAALEDPARLFDSPQVRRTLCAGLRAHFELRGINQDVLASFNDVIPFVDSSTWPGALREAAWRHEQDARSIEASWEGDFTLEQGGQYVVFPESYEGVVRTTFDAVSIPVGNQMPLHLDAGPHHFTMTGRFNGRSTEPNARVSWSGPLSGNRMKVLPFYRFAPVDQDCLARTPEAAASPAPPVPAKEMPSAPEPSTADDVD